jgi:hypothetical protein
MIDWNIQSRAHGCQACHKPFHHKESFHTLLFDQKHGYERLDICEKCWESQYSQGASDRKGFISYWQSVYAEPPPPAPDAIQKETAETLLRKIVETNDPQYSAARFILAVMLERKRLLKVKAQVAENNQRLFIYEHVRSGDLFNIPDPNLQLDQLEFVQRQVADLLENGLALTATAEETPSANGPEAIAPPEGQNPVSPAEEPAPV